MLPSIAGKLFSQLRNCWADMRSAEETQRLYLREELSQARGLLPLLMKHRNGQRWSAEERKLLLRELCAVSRLSPYLVPLLMPGGVLLLPLLAWWLDRRQRRRNDAVDDRVRERGLESVPDSPSETDASADRAGKA